MKPLLLAVPGDEALARDLAARADAEPGRAVMRDFPDGEPYVRVMSPVAGRTVWLLCTFHPPREKLCALFFLASTVRDLGAGRVILVAPYLGYLRQDARFHEGEGITSRYAARLLSGLVDEIYTVDPHLHRYRSLDEVYDIPAHAIASAPRMAAWVRENVERPVIVGPDAESAQWVEAVAGALGCQAVVLEKTRCGDREVSIAPPDAAALDRLRGRRPVILDDILSTGRTMVEALEVLGDQRAGRPICLAVHAVFATSDEHDPARELARAGAHEVVTCNTIAHPTNRIDVLGLLAGALG